MLVIKDLRAGIEGNEILKGINLEVKPGEIHAVMGPNGSGKSTLAHTLAGHPSYEVSGGRVWLEEEGESLEILEMSPDERAKVGLFLAFQYPVEVPGVRVSKFLRLAYEERFGEERKFESVLLFNQYLEEIALELEVKPELIKRGLNEGFSGGEKKRLEILQMAVLEPKYAVLDETDSGLDIDAIKAVAGGVKRVVEKFNTGILVITHYQRILKYLKPEFVHVMRDGVVVESGGVEVAERLERKGYKK